MLGAAPLFKASTYCSISAASIFPLMHLLFICLAGVSQNTLCFKIEAFVLNSFLKSFQFKVSNFTNNSSSSTGLIKVKSSLYWKFLIKASLTFLLRSFVLLEKLESLFSKYSFSVMSLPFSFNSKAKSLKSHKNLGVVYCKAYELDQPLADLTLIKFESSAANDRQEIEFSSIVYMELKIKKLLNRTTKANILASWF